ncbi:hypothetical protein GCM10010466_51240 [Planomonospora alba]|uniref:Secreted protein n=1 Tax=Planomonospora alba TaxID=161354 RepID=A0ABP6NNB8_9ACTN
MNGRVKMSMRRRAAVVAAAALVTSGIATAVPASASASAGGYGCSGSLVGSWPVPSRDTLTGKKYYVTDVKLYYNAKTGWNCAVYVKRKGSPRYGRPTPMLLTMYNQRWTEDRMKNNYDSDSGDFKYYAGPVKVYGKNMCVSISVLYSDGEVTRFNKKDKVHFNTRHHLTGLACR